MHGGECFAYAHATRVPRGGFQRAIIYRADEDGVVRAFEIRAGEEMEFSPDELHGTGGDARQRLYRMIESASESEDRKVSVVPYAVLVPLLVVMAQSAWVVQKGWSFRHNALLAGVLHPVVLGGMVVIGLVSFFVIRPFARRAGSRWVAFIGCVLGFTVVIESLMPKLAE